MSELTGRWIIKQSRGRMAVRVERRSVSAYDSPGTWHYHWHWAKAEDLIDLNIPTSGARHDT